MAPSGGDTTSANPDDPFAQQLRALRLEYLTSSLQRVDELRQVRARLEEGEVAALKDLRQAFHRLAGSGGSYGFPLVSSSSREGEQLASALIGDGRLPEAADLSALDACISRIAEAFDQARRQIDAGGAAGA
jgi:hypothetical protein